MLLSMWQHGSMYLIEENLHGFHILQAIKMKLQGLGISLMISLLQGHPWWSTKWVRPARDFGNRVWQNQEPAVGGWIPRDEEKGTRVFFWAPHEVTTTGYSRRH